MFVTRTRLFFFACLKYAAGAALKSAAPASAPGSDPTKKSAPAPQHCATLHRGGSNVKKICSGSGAKKNRR